ncbi:MAG: class I SAM-dependent methyltransferase [Candidatus Electrothrix sp. AW2]|nr:class I SAM-dependent methyltransferase [Candidatus Electrothrix gigas]
MSINISYTPPRYLLRRYEVLRHVRPGKQFIEIGAGHLKLSLDLLNSFESGTALDYSKYIESAYQALPASVQQRLTLSIGDIQELHIKTQFDCVVSCEVMEHVEDDRLFLRQIKSLLCPDGQIILSVPSRMKYWAIDDEIVGHFRRYERKDIINLFKDVGFENIKLLSYGFPFTNLLRLLRILLAKKQQRRKKHWDQRQLTEESGVHHASGIPNFLAIFVNRYTMLPLNIIASLFNRFDWSDGYIIIAKKQKSRDP